MATIYYMFVSPPNTGGDSVNVDHVAALNRMGLDARAFYCVPNEGLAQFPVPVAPSTTIIRSDDVVVMGETQRQLFDLGRDVACTKVLHNQNPYFTFYGFDSVAALNAYPFVHILAPSDFGLTRLRALGVTHAISRVHPALPDYFRPCARQLQIAFSPMKREIEARYLVQYFRSRAPEYAHVPWIPLVGLTRRDCAQAMAASAVFAALPLLESLGLMSLEAMASGCHVVGYTGHGGAEYTRADNGDWIADGDHDGFVTALRAACRLFESGAANPKITAGQATAAHYSQAAFDEQLRGAWTTILGGRIGLYRR